MPFAWNLVTNRIADRDYVISSIKNFILDLTSKILIDNACILPKRDSVVAYDFTSFNLYEFQAVITHMNIKTSIQQTSQTIRIVKTILQLLMQNKFASKRYYI